MARARGNRSRQGGRPGAGERDGAGTEAADGASRCRRGGIGAMEQWSPRRRLTAVFAGVVGLAVATVGPVYACTGYFHSNHHHRITTAARHTTAPVGPDNHSFQPITPTPTVSQTPTAAPTPTTVTSAPPPAAAQPPAPAAGSGSIPSSFPNAGNTGVPAGTSLTAHSGDTSINTDGMVINGWDLHGSLDIYANNVTIINSRITSTNWWVVNLRQGATGLRVLHSTLTGVLGQGQDNGGVDYGVSNMSNGTLEVGYCNVSGVGSGLSTGHGNLHDNYVHDLASFRNASGGMEHTQPVISSGDDTGGLVIRHNTLLNQMTTDQGASASVGLFADNGPVTNTTVDGNYIAGGSYAVYGGGSNATNIKVTNNVFSAQFWPGVGYYGPVADFNAGGSGNVWSNNVFSGGPRAGAQVSAQN